MSREQSLDIWMWITICLLWLRCSIIPNDVAEAFRVGTELGVITLMLVSAWMGYMVRVRPELRHPWVGFGLGLAYWLAWHAVCLDSLLVGFGWAAQKAATALIW